MSCSQNTITPRTPIGADGRLSRLYLLYTRASQIHGAPIYTTQRHARPVCNHQVVAGLNHLIFSVPAITLMADEGLTTVTGNYTQVDWEAVEVRDWLQRRVFLGGKGALTMARFLRSQIRIPYQHS